jgi:hypothetical protein
MTHPSAMSQTRCEAYAAAAMRPNPPIDWLLTEAV